MQIAYARGLLSLEDRNRVYKVMYSMQLPFWHFTCNAELFCKASPIYSLQYTCLLTLNLLYKSL